MTQHYVVGSLTLKQFLFLMAAVFAAITTLLSIWFTSAATATGSQPSLAISLVEGSNTGILGANQQRWFRMMADASPSAIPLEKRFIVTSSAPLAGNDLSLSLQIFEGKATPSPYDDNLTGLTLVGRGQPDSGGKGMIDQLLWQGQLSPGKTYYLYLVNRSNISLEYQLQMQQVATRPPAAQVEKTVVPTATPTPVAAERPDQAAPLLPSLNTSKLGPSSRHWYTFTANSAEPDQFQTFKFSLFFTPDNGQRRYNVNFELFTAAEVARWQQGETNQLTNFGAGMLLSRDGDPNTGERLWRGTVIKGETYFLVIENGTDIEIDYWLFDQDIEHPELGIGN